MDDFLLGPYVVKPSVGHVERGDAVVRLRARVMDLLVFFAQHPDVVLSPQRLLEGVWGTTFVSHSALTRTIAELRGALGDDADHPWLLETISKRGYRLLARPSFTAPLPNDAGNHQHAPAAPVTEAPAPPERLWLKGDSLSLALPIGRHIIGRDVTAAIVLASPWVSRHHAAIEVTADGATLEDLGSRNGTFLDGRQVTGPVSIGHGEAIQIGSTRLVAYLVAPDLPTVSDMPADSPDGRDD